MHRNPHLCLGFYLGSAHKSYGKPIKSTHLAFSNQLLYCCLVHFEPGLGFEPAPLNAHDMTKDARDVNTLITNLTLKELGAGREKFQYHVTATLGQQVLNQHTSPRACCSPSAHIQA
jgi:hypothetical protein